MTWGQTVPERPPTVGEIVAALLTLDQSLPLVVSTGYDNDSALSSGVGIQIDAIKPEGDGNIWVQVPAGSFSQDPSHPDYDPSVITSVLIQGNHDT